MTVAIAVGDANADPFQTNKAATAAPPAQAVVRDAAADAAVLADYQRRVALINAMTARFAGDAATQFGSSFNTFDWGRDFGSRLIFQSTKDLSAASGAPNLATMQQVLFSRRDVATKHDTDTENRVTLVTPCRVVDTRFGGGGDLGPSYRFWEVFHPNPATIPNQGGNPSGCGSYPDANGFLLYVTVVPPPGQAGAEFLTVQHDSSPTPPAAATMNYYNQNLANFAITGCNGCGGGTSGGFNAYSTGFTDVVIDLVGVLSRSANTVPLDCVTTALNRTWGNGTLSSTSGVTNTLSVPACPAGYTATSVIADFDVDGSDVTGSCNLTSCNVWTGHAHAISLGQGVGARCCRLPSGI